MGQAMQKLRRPGATAVKRATAPAPPPPPPRPTPQTLRQSVEVRPQPPEPQPIIEPEQNMGEWNRGDPKYSAMVQQVVGKISTRLGGKQEMGSAHVTEEFRRPMPVNRHTSAETGPDEEKVVAAGTLNIVGFQEALRLHQGLTEGQEKPMDVKAIAEKFKLDEVLLEKVFKYTSLPETQRCDPSQKLRT